MLRAKVTAKFLEKTERTYIPLCIGVRGEGGVENQRPWVGGYGLQHFPGTLYEVSDRGTTVGEPGARLVDVAMSWTNKEGFLDHLTARLAAGK